MIDSTLFEGLMEQVGPFEAAPHIVVAVSGGSDSIALVLLCHEWAKAHQGNVTALTVDHGLRKEASEEAEMVASWLSNYGIAHHILRSEEKLPTANIQDEARKLRYRLLCDWCIEHHVLHLLTGHTADDQIETFFLRLERGSGIHGLSAMSRITEKQGIRHIRPLLSVDKTSLQSYLSSKKQAWIEDPSNQQMHYRRNHIRALLTQETEGDNYFETISRLGETRSLLETMIADNMVNTVTFFKEGYASIDKKAFMELPLHSCLQIIGNVLATISGQYYPPRYEKLHTLHKSLMDDTLHKMTLWGCVIEKQDDQIICYRELAAIEDQVVLSPYHWDQRFMISCNHTRMVVRPLRQEGVTTLKASLDLSTLNLPKAVLMTLPALYSADLEILLAVPHIDYYDENTDITVACKYAPIRPLTLLPFEYCTQN